MSILLGIIAWVLAFNFLFLALMWWNGRKYGHPLDYQKLRKRPDVRRKRLAKSLHR